MCDFAGAVARFFLKVAANKHYIWSMKIRFVFDSRDGLSPFEAEVPAIPSRGQLVRHGNRWFRVSEIEFDLESGGVSAYLSAGFANLIIEKDLTKLRDRQ